MGKRHKWADVIVAWSEGAEIEVRCLLDNGWTSWSDVTATYPSWFDENEYRIKPTPKEPQYLYVFADLADWEATRTSVINRKKDYETYIGKIKLEGDE